MFARPRFMVWENVPGAFSSGEPKGEDFRIVLEEIIRIVFDSVYVPRPYTGRWESAGRILLGDSFSLAWRVLDAQYWGVPQRRRRIYLVADFGGQTAPKYYLTRKACLGILRRASERGKPLPEQLRIALEIQAGLRGASPLTGGQTAFTANQRDEVRNLHDIAGALGAQAGMKQQTFIAESEPVLCLNDQGGEVMDCTENITETLRTQMHSHQPRILESNQEHARVCTDGLSPTLSASMGMGGGYVPVVYENHGIDSRYTGSHEVSPTISARCGTGGNNVPLVEQDASIYCIVGNVIDR